MEKEKFKFRFEDIGLDGVVVRIFMEYVVLKLELYLVSVRILGWRGLRLEVGEF